MSSSLILLAASVGYDSSMMNGLEALPQWNKFMGDPVSIRLGWINALYWITVGVAVIFSSFSSNKYGRRFTLWFGFIPLVIGVICQTAAQNQATWIVGRVFLGFPGGVFGAAAPLLMTEV